ncbi:hypothetical protein RI367_005963 [Sorochytrium milnesiophthora]
MHRDADATLGEHTPSGTLPGARMSIGSQKPRRSRNRAKPVEQPPATGSGREPWVRSVNDRLRRAVVHAHTLPLPTQRYRPVDGSAAEDFSDPLATRICGLAPNGKTWLTTHLAGAEARAAAPLPHIPGDDTPHHSAHAKRTMSVLFRHEPQPAATKPKTRSKVAMSTSQQLLPNKSHNQPAPLPPVSLSLGSGSLAPRRPKNPYDAQFLS